MSEKTFRKLPKERQERINRIDRMAAEKGWPCIRKKNQRDYFYLYGEERLAMLDLIGAR